MTPERAALRSAGDSSGATEDGGRPEKKMTKLGLEKSQGIVDLIVICGL